MGNVAIHGFGRIGRSTMRVALLNDLFSPVSISDIRDAESFAALFSVDSNYGFFPEPVSAKGDTLIVGDVKLDKVFSGALTVGTSVNLVFTATNFTNSNQTFSFTDTLPAGLAA